MKNILLHIERYLNILEKVLAYISLAIASIVMLMITADVMMRYLFRKPIIGVFELSEFAMVGIVFLGVAYVQSIKGHVNVPILIEKLSPKTQASLTIFGYLLGFASLSIITWASASATWTAFVTGDYAMGIIHFPTWPAKLSVPLGLSVLNIRLIIDILKDCQRLRSGHEPRV